MEGSKEASVGYRVIRPIATGEYGCVLLVSLVAKGNEASRCPRPVALKIMKPTSRPSNEYTILKAFRSKAVPHTVHAVGSVRIDTLPQPISQHLQGSPLLKGGGPYDVIVMQYVPGPTLRAHLEACATTRSSPGEWWYAVARHLCAFAYYAFREFRVTHGDLKLSNIIVESVSPPTLTVVDLSFGERYASSSGKRDPTPAVEPIWQKGTPCFMAPERLFFTERPDWVDDSAAAAGDLWSIGVIMASAALTGHSFPDMDEYQQLEVLDESGAFNPGYTDTVYQLLSTRTMPWFFNLTTVISTDSNLPHTFVVAAVRLILWTHVLGKECFPVYLEGVQYERYRAGSARFQMLSHYMDHIYSDYAKHGRGIFESVLGTLKSVLGTHFNAYLFTQRWDPLLRGRTEPTLKTDNPFEWFYTSFETILPTTRVFPSSPSVWSTIEDKDNVDGEETQNMTRLFSRLCLNWCHSCGATVNPRGKTKLCLVCNLALVSSSATT